ncbi:MAG: hypothetical protein KGO49_02325 [Gammaproteobacteria bacterium]|nr:hypothetical protein [Gammaproteobacteria bacterium]
MISFNTKAYSTLFIILALDISGCSTMENKNKVEKTRILGVPTATIETNPEILNLEANVRKSPNDPVAWSALAKAYFDHQKYDLAIQAGNSSLQLKPDNPDVRNIVFVSGLRIASSSLDGIRKDQPLTGSNLADAQTLVGTIRQSLGETSLTNANTQAPESEKPVIHHTKKKKKNYTVKHERTAPLPKTDTTLATSSKSNVISNQPVGAPKPAQTPAVQAAANNPFGAFK